MENSNGTVKVIGALIAGALIGAGIGILFAPDKGSRTRRKIADGAKDFAEDAKEKIKEEADALRKKAEKLESMAKDKINDFKHKSNHKSETATATANL